MIARLLTLDEIKSALLEYRVVYLKYVCINGEYRFISSSDGWTTPDHRHMLDEEETAESAAYVTVYRDPYHVRVTEWSMTLKIGPSLLDEENITRLLKDIAIEAQIAQDQKELQW